MGPTSRFRRAVLHWRPCAVARACAPKPVAGCRGYNGLYAKPPRFEGGDEWVAPEVISRLMGWLDDSACGLMSMVRTEASALEEGDCRGALVIACQAPEAVTQGVRDVVGAGDCGHDRHG